MSTPLLQQFPSFASYPSSFLKDLLSSPQLVEAFLFTLPEVQHLAAEVEELARENEEIASGSSLSICFHGSNVTVLGWWIGSGKVLNNS